MLLQSMVALIFPFYQWLSKTSRYDRKLQLELEKTNFRYEPLKQSALLKQLFTHIYGIVDTLNREHKQEGANTIDVRLERQRPLCKLKSERN